MANTRTPKYLLPRWLPILLFLLVTTSFFFTLEGTKDGIRTGAVLLLAALLWPFYYLPHLAKRRHAKQIERQEARRKGFVFATAYNLSMFIPVILILLLLVGSVLIAVLSDQSIPLGTWIILGLVLGGIGVARLRSFLDAAKGGEAGEKDSPSERETSPSFGVTDSEEAAETMDLEDPRNVSADAELVGAQEEKSAPETPPESASAPPKTPEVEVLSQRVRVLEEELLQMWETLFAVTTETATEHEEAESDVFLPFSRVHEIERDLRRAYIRIGGVIDFLINEVTTVPGENTDLISELVGANAEIHKQRMHLVRASVTDRRKREKDYADPPSTEARTGEELHS